MQFVVIDFETASAADLRKTGAWKYAECPTTEVLCLGYSIDGEAGKLWLPGMPPPEWLDDFKVLVIAHNCLFEKAIWRRIMVDQYGWPDIPNSRWHDSMAACAMKGIPLKLERAAAALRLREQTNKGHSRIVTAPSKANKRGEYDRSDELLTKVYEENRQDVRCEVELNYRVGGLQRCERNVWLLDQRINERGVLVDLAFVSACQKIVDDAAIPLVGRFREITGGIEPTQTARVVEWVRAQGVDLPNLQKGTIDELLGIKEDDDDDEAGDEFSDTPLFNLPAHVRTALGIRRTVGSSSIKKLAAIRSSACSDGRVRGVVQYHGAGPGRWVGRLFQPQNFPRGSLTMHDGDGEIGVDPDLLVSAIMSGDHEYVASLFGSAHEAVISGLRHAILAGPGRTLNVGDFNTIEARVVLALAGASKALAVLQDKERDVYCEMASTIFHVPAPKGKPEISAFKAAHLEKRQTGKNTVLGCGFQMGWRKFQARYCPEESEEFAKAAVNAYREDFAPEVPDLWAGLEEAAIRAVWDKRPTEAYGIRYAWEDIWLTCRLPSGRKLYYPYPEPCKKAMPWDEKDIRAAWTCKASKNGRFITRDMYGGLLTENVVQATARDLLVAAMFTCEKENLPIVLTVHDEIVSEPLQTSSSPAMVKQIMETRPQWAVDLGVPVAAETWGGPRYKK